MATNYSPEIVTDGAVLVGDARMPSISEPGTRLYDRAGVDSADVKLLIHGNVGSGQNFADSSLSNHTITANGDVTHSTTQSKFSGGSIYFDGSDSLSVPDSADWNIGSGDFTMDAWVYFNDVTNIAIHNQSNGGAGSDSAFIVWISGGSTASIYLSDGSGWDYNNINSATLSTGQWYHLAAVRHGDSLRMYVDGVSTSATSLSSGWTVGDSSRVLQIGEQDGSQYMDGYLDEVRFIKGVALWTQNFTPPARRDTLSISDGMMYNGTCAEFDGTNDYVDTGSTFQSTFRNSFSFSTWVRSNDGQEAGLPKLMGMRNSTYQDWIHVGFDVGKLEMYYASNNSGKYGETASAVLGAGVTAWHHVVAVADEGAAQMYLYFDGVLQTLGAGSVDGDLTGIDFSLFTTTDNLYLAARNKFSSTSEENLNGSMADARLYNCALSAAQVKEIYDNSKVIIPSNVPQTNLAALWTLAEGSGDILYDGSGNGNNGTFENEDGDEWLTGQTGPPQLVEGYNRAMLFDGGNDGAIKDVADYRSGDSSGTMAAWVNFNALDDYQVVFGSFDFSSATRYIEIFLRNDGKIAFAQSNNDTGDYFYYNTALTVNTWYHVAVTSDGSSYTFYVNGAEVTKTFGGGSDTGDWFADTANRDNICIGVLKYNSTHGNWMDGLTTEVVVYDTPLSAGQISTLATTDANGGPLPPLTLPAASNVVGHWRYDNNVTWTDLSSGGNNLTVTGSPSSLLFKQGINGSASTSTGRDGQGFPLLYENNGAIGFVSDSVDFGNVVSFDNTDNFTVEAWFKAALDGSGNGFSYQPIISKEGSAEFGYGIKLDYNVAGGPWLYGIATGTTSRYQYSSALNAGQWYHACVTFNSSANYITVFIDGAQNHGPYSAQGAFNGTTNTNSLKLGNGSYSTADFRGQIGSSKIYNRLLSQAEIKQNYNAQKSRFT